MKNIFKLIFMGVTIFLVYTYRNNITNFITDNIIYLGSNKVLTYNEFYLDNDYMYVQNIDKNEVDSYQELINMFYSIINSGDDAFTFKCNYSECINNVKEIINNEETISEINNFVNPFNSFSSININITATGKVTVNINKLYTEEEIIYITTYINEFITNDITSEMSDTDKIKAFHDHIINNTVYDQNTSKNAYSAYNLLTTGTSICGGYSDIMSIYLNILGIKNYRIASQNHIWNLVYLNDNWYHLDLTWDDPVASDGNQYLIHNFFLITTTELLSLDKVEHNFNTNIYLEANNN